ncbi:MAG: YtxH domain-containing protein [Gemmatimonadota bacterium]
MYYDDEARRFNFVSGLVLGAVLGTGLALLLPSRERLRKPRRIRDSATAVRRGAGGRLARTRAALRDAGPNPLEQLRKLRRR